MVANPSLKNVKHTAGLIGTVPVPDLRREVLAAIEEVLTQHLPNKDVRGLIMKRVRKTLREDKVTFSSNAKKVPIPRLVSDACHSPASVILTSLAGFRKPAVLILQKKEAFAGLEVIDTLPWTKTQKAAMRTLATEAGWTKLWLLTVEPVSTIPPICRSTCRVQPLTRDPN